MIVCRQTKNNSMSGKEIQFSGVSMYLPSSAGVSPGFYFQMLSGVLWNDN